MPKWIVRNRRQLGGFLTRHDFEYAGQDTINTGLNSLKRMVPGLIENAGNKIDKFGPGKFLSSWYLFSHIHLRSLTAGTFPFVPYFKHETQGSISRFLSSPTHKSSACLWGWSSRRTYCNKPRTSWNFCMKLCSALKNHQIYSEIFK